jgi:predicted nucleotidyltransferase
MNSTRGAESVFSDGRRYAGREERTVAMAQTAIDQEKIASFCRRHHIERFALFGSALRRDFRSDSDVDVLVEFSPGHVPGSAFFAMEK